LRFALLRHDAAIAGALARQVAERWRDLLTLLVALPILALFARVWLAQLVVDRREIIVGVAGFVIAATLAKAVAERLDYHRTEGALAHHAQRSSVPLSFVLPLLAGGLAILLAGMASIAGLPSISLAGWIAAGTALGLLLAVAANFVPRFMAGPMPTPPRMLGHRREMGLVAVFSAAVGLAGALLPSQNHLDGLVAGGYALAVVVLAGQVDATAVRYMTMVGHSAATMLRKSLTIQLALLVPFAAVLALAQDWMAASVAAIAAIGLPCITALRILAYRAFGRILADWLVSIFIAIAAYLTLTLPPLGVLAILAAMVWFARKGTGTRWLIA